MEVPKTTAESSAEQAREEIEVICREHGVNADAREGIVAGAIELLRRSWIEGKEFGWKKAWNWKSEAKPGDREALKEASILIGREISCLRNVERETKRHRELKAMLERAGEIVERQIGLL